MLVTCKDDKGGEGGTYSRVPMEFNIVHGRIVRLQETTERLEDRH